MRRSGALALVLITVVVVRAVGGSLEIRGTALAMGLVLIAASLTGDLVAFLRLPRVTGYLLFGMLSGPFLGNLISRSMARELQLFNGLAVALIALVAGLEMDIGRLRPRLPSMLRVGGATVGVTNLGFLILFWLVWPWLGIEPDATGLAKLGMVLVLATLASCSSPSVAIAIITESRAAGLLSELVVAVVILGDLVLILLFTMSMQLVELALSGTAGEIGLFVRLMWQILGSFGFGACLGSLFALYLKYVGRETTLVLLALCAILSEVGHRLQFEPVLAALAAGFTITNVTPALAEALADAVERGSVPVLVIFFAAAGATLQLDALASIGLVAVGVAVARAFFYRVGTGLGARLSGIGPPVEGLVWMGLISQAGVTLGLSVTVAAEYPDWGLRVQTLVLALIALHQLAGPVLFRAALARAGEVGRGGLTKSG